MPQDIQSAVIAEVIARLVAVESFGAYVIEDSVLRLLDAADTELPDDLIVIQPGPTEEVERAAHNSVRERVTLNITAITKRRHFAPALRAARLGIKVALAGLKCGLTTPGVQVASFSAESPMPPSEGRRLACHVMPLEITYVQPLK